MKEKNYFLLLNLQAFAEGGGDGGTSAAGATADSGLASATNGSNDLSEVKYGKQDEVQNATVQANESQANDVPDRTKEFEKLIKGEYKDLYDQRVQDTIQKRLKGTKETVDRYNSLMPTLDLLASKYGVDASDVEALNRAIEEDDSFFEEEALEKGLTVEQLKSIRKMERENADLKRQMQEQETQERANRLYSSWLEQADGTKSVYPQFDLDVEMQNPRFVDLLRSNVDVRTAYEVLHKDEIIPAAMQFTARKVEENVAKKVMANRSRPLENGMNSQSASLVKSDVSQLSKEDRAEINRRVLRGEKIRF